MIAKPVHHKPVHHKSSSMGQVEFSLWQAYQQDRTADNRNALVVFYLPLLHTVALSVKRKLRGSPLEVLESDGVLGLIGAVERFDPTTGIPFGGYASRRIRGEIIDEVRRRDTVSRSARTHTVKMEEAKDDLRSSGVAPSQDDLLVHLRVPAKNWDRWRKDAVLCGVKTHHLHDSIDGVSTDTFADILADKHTAHHGAASAVMEWWQSLTDELDDTQFVVFILRHGYGWTLHTIGLHIGLRNTRIQQISTQLTKFVQWRKSDHQNTDIPISAVPFSLREILPICSRLRHARVAMKPPRLASKAA